MSAQRNTTELEENVFEYLNELRESGAVNMFGSSIYLIQDFGLDKRTARRLVGMWMQSFDADGLYSVITTDEPPIYE
jgi:hypothetical protein